MRMSIVLILIIIISVISYNAFRVPNSVSGINTGGTTLVVNQSSSQTKQLHYLIKQVLEKNSSALSELINFNCGGGSGCYDLGYFLTQIVYQMGEDEFVIMASELNSVDKRMLLDFIRAGLEYGYGYDYSEVDKLGIETAFPSLYAGLKD